MEMDFELVDVYAKDYKTAPPGQGEGQDGVRHRPDHLH